ncbi:MAG: hypothetical protein SF066_03340 [Thermoanaerobaculia bacterium]|nr:hypothetical protein [Thermoanaerobaculia bacterium]
MPLAVFLATAAAYAGVIFGLFPHEPFLKYPTLARQALEGTLSPERRLDLSPLYLGFHELLAVVGAPAGTAELLQILAVALATALLASLLRPRVGLGPTLVACGLFAAGGGLVTYTATLEPEAFLVLTVTVFLWAVLAAPRRPAVAGLALAVAGILRPNLLPLAVLVPLGFWLEARRGDAEVRRRARRAALLVALPALVAVAALLSRNATLPGPFTPFVMNPGTVFFEGNHPWAEGTAATYPPLFPELIPLFAGSPDPQHELYRLFARRATGEELTVAQVNGFWRARAWNFLVDHPGLTLKRVGRKFLAVLGGYSWHDLPTAHWNERRLGWSVLWASGLLLALALWGLERAVIGVRHSWPLLLLGALQLAVLLTVYASARQRLALWPVAAVLAGWALAPTTVRRFSRRSILVWTALLFLVTTVLRSEGTFDRHLFSAVDASSRIAAEARAARTAGVLDAAATRAAQAFVAAPWRIEALHPAYVPGIADALAREIDRATHLPPFERGRLALAAGRTESASASFVLASFERRRYEGTDSSEPFYYQALVLHRRGAPAAEVAGALAAGLRETPGDPEILAALAVLGAEGQPREALFRYWDPLTANFFLGRQALRFDRREACFAPLQFVHERLPEFRRGAIHLAACLGATGRPEEGARVFVEANRKVQEPLVLEAEILGLFRDLVTRHPDDPTTLRLAAAAHRQYGRTPEALALLERLAAVTGGSDPGAGESLR